MSHARSSFDVLRQHPFRVAEAVGEATALPAQDGRDQPVVSRPIQGASHGAAGSADHRAATADDESVIIVMNAASGHDNANDLSTQLAESLVASGRNHTLHVVRTGESIDDAARRAASQASVEGGIVVAVGGDGTINAVANAVVPLGVPLGVIPQGTFNYFGRTHGLPEDPMQALRVALEQRPQPVQVGRINGRIFLVNASVGLYPQLLEDREAWKRRFGRSRAVAMVAGIATVMGARRSLSLSWQQNGITVRERTLTLFVGNNRLQIEQLGLPQAQQVENGSLAVIAVRPTSTWSLLGLLIRGSMGRLADADYVKTFVTQQLVVQRAGTRWARRPLKIATDGETFLMQAPLTFDISPQALQLIKPDAPADESAQNTDAVDP